MATLNDLSGMSITDMSDDELQERLRELRLSRRTPTEQRKKKAPKAPTLKETGIAEMNPSSLAEMFSASEAAELLKLLEEE